jgi:hypothetical protein
MSEFAQARGQHAQPEGPPRDHLRDHSLPVLLSRLAPIPIGMARERAGGSDMPLRKDGIFRDNVILRGKFRRALCNPEAATRSREPCYRGDREPMGVVARVSAGVRQHC